jgi:hypothetical protein
MEQADSGETRIPFMRRKKKKSLQNNGKTGFGDI